MIMKILARKLSPLQISNDKNSADSHNIILRASVQDKLKMFHLLDIDLEKMEQKLTELFAPITDLIQLISVARCEY